ncbi:ankyrin repeat domain-containing protein [Legionella yabuuchiae]|uniref:ankyrin repeat domain-containing protein n=1 Tax=Legionella yabuuchiae TaxID=376727 RepID=UPI0010541847|nr:ankyrin repeat domain-containing protein [Legionella yabuuchiae]
MPNLAIYITNLSSHPELNAFLESDPPNHSLIAGGLNTKYRCDISDRDPDFIDSKSLSIIQILSLCGKWSHINTLGFSAIEKKEAVKVNGYLAIQLAAKNGHLTTLQHLETHLTPKEKKEAFKAECYLAIRLAAKSGHLTTLEYLETHFLEYLETHLRPQEKKKAVKADDYYAIKWAAQRGHLTTLQHLETHLTSGEKEEAVKANGYLAIQLSAQRGHLPTLQHLETYLTPKEKKKAVKTNDYYAIKWAAQRGHLTTLQHLETHLTPKEKKQVVKANNYSVVHKAAQRGHLTTLQHLETHLTPKEKKQVVKANNYSAVHKAAQNSHLTTLQHLETHLSPKEKKEAVKADHYTAIGKTAENGHLSTLQYLEAHLTLEEKKEAVKARDYSAIRWAAERGHLSTLQYLETNLTPEEKKEAVKASDYYAIRWAAQRGHLTTLQYLETHFTPEEKKEAVKAGNYVAIREAALNRDKPIINYYLDSCSPVIAFMEMHDREYGEAYVYPFLSDKISSLRERKDQYEDDNPNGVFDLEEVNEAEVCFYMIRNLIRRSQDPSATNQLSLFNDIHFLLSLPAVRGLAHQSVNEGEENELVRFAFGIGNQTAVSLLMQLPEVRRLAARNNYYHREAQGDIDLRAIAQDRESSMVALSLPERKLINKVTSYYQESIHAMGGLDEGLEFVKAALKERYEAHPAVMIHQNTSGRARQINLPLEWGDLQALKKGRHGQLGLTNRQYQAALEAYYQHDVHTAYRYLSKPNHWMAPNASYVYVYERDGRPTTDRYSTFEEYKALIVPFYLAAIDEASEPVDGYSLEGRIEAFIKQLALIGRAHNWDKSRKIVVEGPRPKGDVSQEPLYLKNEAAQYVTEEYDDLEGDKPSCYSGVNRRLFQSVLGHPLFKPLNATLVLQTLNEKIRAYYQEAITRDNAPQLKKAYEALIEFDESNISLDDAARLLNSINIPKKKKNNIINAVLEQLARTHNEDLASLQASFVQIMERRFDVAKAIGSSDFLSFATECGLVNVLEGINRQVSEERYQTSLKASLDSEKDLAPKHPNFFRRNPVSLGGVGLAVLTAIGLALALTNVLESLGIPMIAFTSMPALSGIALVSATFIGALGKIYYNEKKFSKIDNPLNDKQERLNPSVGPIRSSYGAAMSALGSDHRAADDLDFTEEATAASDTNREELERSLSEVEFGEETQAMHFAR